MIGQKVGKPEENCAYVDELKRLLERRERDSNPRYDLNRTTD